MSKKGTASFWRKGALLHSFEKTAPISLKIMKRKLLQMISNMKGIKANGEGTQAGLI